MKKVIYIPGFLGDNKNAGLIEYFLKNKFKIIYFRYDTSGKTGIETSAKKLKKFIDKLSLKKDEKISIIAFSMGGLIATYYCKFIDNKKVDKLINIFTPFKGTFWANIFLDRKALNQMQPDNLFLKKLNKKKLKIIKQKNFWCDKDLIVLGKSARVSPSRKISFFLHSFGTYWPPLIKKIEKELNFKS